MMDERQGAEGAPNEQGVEGAPSARRTPAADSAAAAHAVSPVLIALFRGVLYQDTTPDLWQGLLELRANVRDHAAVFGLELVLDESEGYAYLRQRPPAEGEAELPRLVQKRQLGFSVSLLLALLRKKMIEHDSGGHDARLILSREEIVDLVRVFLPSDTNEARIVDRLDTDLNRVLELGFLRRLRGQPDQYEVRRILKAFVDAQWMADMTQRLAEYRAHLTGEANATAKAEPRDSR